MSLGHKAAKIRAIDLFCGAGGSSWGARSAGVELVAAFDRWPTAGVVYKANFPKAEFYGGKLEGHSATSLAKKLGRIDLILASPECTNHSPAKGKKPRCEKSKETAFQVVRFARAFKPRWIVIENVVNMRRWSRYAEFIEKLKTLDYYVHEQVLCAVDFGVPQSRRRLFIVCDRKRKPTAIEPTRRGRSKSARSILDMNGTYRFSLAQGERTSKADTGTRSTGLC